MQRRNGHRDAAPWRSILGSVSDFPVCLALLAEQPRLVLLDLAGPQQIGHRVFGEVLLQQLLVRAEIWFSLIYRPQNGS